MVEVWPYAQRSSGIAVFQLFGRLAGFFTTFVNPIGLKDVGWKYLISYCCWLAFEVCFVYFMFPETFGRTLEELAFRMFPCLRSFDGLPKRHDANRRQSLRTRRWRMRLLPPSRRLCSRIPLTASSVPSRRVPGLRTRRRWCKRHASLRAAPASSECYCACCCFVGWLSRGLCSRHLGLISHPTVVDPRNLIPSNFPRPLVPSIDTYLPNYAANMHLSALACMYLLI